MPESGEKLTGTTGALVPVSEASCDAVGEHLRQILASPQFKGSHRSQQFLGHVVAKALDGSYDDLKERQLGIHLFGRSPSYDTGEDAIVRVTASDVRRRLQQFYTSGPEFDIRIDLPTGSYHPEFRRSVVARPAPELPPAVIEAAPAVTEHIGTQRKPLRIVPWVIAASLALACLWLWSTYGPPGRTATRALPWSALFDSASEIRVVVSDPDISAVQKLLGFEISLSDYANRQYVPAESSPGPDLRRALESFRGTAVPAVDAAILLRISELAAASSARLQMHTARSLQLRDFKTDHNFIVLGSPRSNPWGLLFQDQLDLDFVYDADRKQEIIRNKRPRAGEAAAYIPTAKGWETGQAFGIVALIPNPNQAGNVLLLAGTNAEATEAAGKLVTNADLLRRTLDPCGIGPRGHSFELLLRVRTIAGSPNTFDVIACHALSPA